MPTVGDLLREVVREDPSRTLLAAPDDPGSPRFSGSELLAAATAVAEGLVHRTGPGARVAAVLPNGAEAVLLQLGCAMAGRTLVPLDPRLPLVELVRVIGVAEAQEVHAASDLAGFALCARLTEALGEQPRAVAVHTRNGRWRELAETAAGRRAGWGAGWGATALPPVVPEAIAQVQFTSGTSGPAKGVLISHAAMVATGQVFAERTGLVGGGPWLNPMPLFHTAGNVLGTMGALCSRAEHVVVPFRPDLVLNALVDTRAALLSAAPTLLDLLLDHPTFTGEGLDALEVVFTGGQRVPAAFTARVERGFGARLTITWGMTETCGSALLTAPDDEDAVRGETVGRALRGVEVAIRDERGEPVTSPGVGELWVRGPRVARHYLVADGERVPVTDEDGWLHTGDLALERGDGAYEVVGRAKDMIKTGGENVTPDQVEALLLAEPDVREVAVVGAADDRWGEIVVACVCLDPALPTGARDDIVDRLEQRCRDGLAPHERPRRWMLLDTLPRTASSKVQRAALRTMVAGDVAGP